MPKIVLSYRRNDTRLVTDRIYEHLEARYGPGNVFMDTGGIPIGADFRKHIRQSLDNCDILIAVIGPNWLQTDSSGKSRLQEKSDWVRLEIGTALQRDIPVIPLLIDDARLPKGEDLPEDLQGLEFKYAARFDSGDFKNQIRKLIAGLDELIGPGEPTPSPPPSAAPGLSGAADAGQGNASLPLGERSWQVGGRKVTFWDIYFAVLVLLMLAVFIAESSSSRNNSSAGIFILGIFMWLAFGVVTGIERAFHKWRRSRSTTPPR